MIDSSDEQQDPKYEPISKSTDEENEISDESRPVSFKYSGHPGILIIGSVFGGVGGAFMWNHAASNRVGVIINGLIELGPENATRFYYLIAIMAFAIAALAIFLGIPSLFIHRQITLSDDSITLPGWGFSTAHYTVSPKDIASVSFSAYRQYRFITIWTRIGKFGVNSGSLADDQFEKVLQWLQSHVGAVSK